MLTALLGAALRGGMLLLVVWVLLKLLRLHDPAVEKNGWTLVVAGALVMPLLAWLGGVLAPPLRVVPLKLLPTGPVASTAALTGIASGVAGSRTALVCTLVYLAGAAVLLTRFAIGLWIGARLRRHASMVSALHVGPIDVRVSAAIRSPASFASTVLLPSTYETWDKTTLASVLAHEQAHIRNWDCYRLWLAALYRAVFWFNPLAHWVHWRLRVLSELTSDETAAAAMGDSASYAATLKQMASSPQFIPSTIAMADSPSLGRRIRRLLSQQGSRAPLALRWKALLMGVLLAMIVLTAVPWASATAPVTQPAANLEFHLADEQNSPVQAQQSGRVPRGDHLYMEQDGTPILLKRDVVATGAEVTHVTAMTTPEGPMVDIRLDARGAASMLSTTRQNIGHHLAVVYNGRVVNAGLIRGAFGGRFQVSGLTAAEASALAMQFDRATPNAARIQVHVPRMAPHQTNTPVTTGDPSGLPR